MKRDINTLAGALNVFFSAVHDFVGIVSEALVPLVRLINNVIMDIWYKKDS